MTQPGGTALPGEYGIYGDIPSKDGTCSGEWGINYVRRSAVIVLSGSDSYISPTTVTMGSKCRNKFDFVVKDLNNNPMPAGTTVDTANNYVYFTPFGTTASTKATTSILYGTPIGNTTHLGGTTVTMMVDADCSAGVPVSYPAGEVDIVTTTPGGKKVFTTITVN